MKILILCAHPDDEVLGMGGTIKKMSKKHTIQLCVVSEGSTAQYPDKKSKEHIDRLKNFGHAGEESVVSLGINGKMCEVNAALGLLQLKYIKDIFILRKEIDATYRKLLQDTKGVHCLQDAGEKVANYSYFPILVDKSYPLTRDELHQKLKDKGVFSRKYF